MPGVTPYRHARKHKLVVRCFGSFRVLGNAGWEPGPPLKKGRELLAYLVTHPRSVVAKDKLIDAFWPGVSGDEGAHRVHLAVSGARCSLRSLLPGIETIQSYGGAYALNPTLDVESDVDAFLAHANAVTIPSLQAGVALYRGEFLAGDRGDWIEPMRIRCSSSYLEMLMRLANDAAERHDYGCAIEYGLRVMENDPGHEAGARGVMRAFAAIGRRSAALLHYEGLRSYLERHLAVSPADETTRLCAEIRRGTTTTPHNWPARRAADR